MGSAAQNRFKQASAPPGGSEDTQCRAWGHSIDRLLHLADNALILGQRNAEWCGHGPILEEDLAMANQSLDLIGQARLLYQHICTLVEADPALAARFAHLRGARDNGRLTEDTLAYFRAPHEFLNHTLLELPHHGPLAGPAAADRDYATTTARNVLYSALMTLRWEQLQSDPDATLAAIAAKSVKETRYHFNHGADWLVRFGDGTADSHARAQAALDHLWPYTQAFWTDPEVAPLQAAWDAELDAVLAEATLRRPAPGGYLPQGHRGVHSEHLGFLLAEMQSLARAHPEAVW